MDRHTVVNFGAIIVTGIIISVLIALATPFGNMIGEALVSYITHEKQWTDTKLEENLSDKTGKDMEALFDTTEALAPGLYPHGSSFATLTEEELIKGFQWTEDNIITSCQLSADELVGDLVLPNNTTNVSTSVFAGFNKLTVVRLAPQTKLIGIKTFQNCSELTTFIAGKSLSTISDSAFIGCKKLEYVSLNTNLQKICYNAFGDCPLLTTIQFEGTRGEWNSINKESGWASNSLKEIVCSDGTIKTNQ